MKKEAVTTAGRPITLSVFMDEMQVVAYDLRWIIGLIVVLVIVDFWFGLKVSIDKKEKFRLSRAGRRTCNKFVDYICYLVVGAFLGMAIFKPLGLADHVVTAAVAMGLGCCFEIDSIIDHVCYLHGIRKRFSIKLFLISLIKKKDTDIGDALEETLNNKDK